MGDAIESWCVMMVWMLVGLREGRVSRSGIGGMEMKGDGGEDVSGVECNGFGGDCVV